MEKLDNIRENFASIENKSEDDRKELIYQLYDLRTKTLKLIDKANSTLQKKRSELNEINKTICEIQGHNYTDWIEHDGVLDRTWYYSRKCHICGNVEYTEEEPLEYKNQLLKKRKQ